MAYQQHERLLVSTTNEIPGYNIDQYLGLAFGATVRSRGMGGGKAWMLGSVSSRVIEDSPCPILVVK